METVYDILISVMIVVFLVYGFSLGILFVVLMLVGVQELVQFILRRVKGKR